MIGIKEPFESAEKGTGARRSIDKLLVLIVNLLVDFVKVAGWAHA
jgi:hypothetical protein